jgi:hypothetical protein
MNKLLSDYESARKAIFEHCGVEADSTFPLWLFTNAAWKIESHHWVVLCNSGALLSIEDGEHGIKRGEEVALVSHDESGECDYVWLALNNALELK